MKSMMAAANRRLRAWVELGEIGREKEKRPTVCGNRGYMRPPWGHRTLLKVHQTRPVTTGLKHREHCKSRNHRTIATGRWTSIRCLRARQVEPPDAPHRTHLETVRASGEYRKAYSPHRMRWGCVRCIVWCTSSQFFNRELRSTFTQSSSNLKKTQINTNWNWYE